MSDRVTVVDPYSGASVNVAADSPQAKAWPAEDAPKAPAKKAASTRKSSK